MKKHRCSAVGFLIFPKFSASCRESMVQINKRLPPWLGQKVTHNCNLCDREERGGADWRKWRTPASGNLQQVHRRRPATISLTLKSKTHTCVAACRGDWRNRLPHSQYCLCTHARIYFFIHTPPDAERPRKDRRVDLINSRPLKLESDRSLEFLPATPLYQCFKSSAHLRYIYVCNKFAEPGSLHIMYIHTSCCSWVAATVLKCSVVCLRVGNICATTSSKNRNLRNLCSHLNNMLTETAWSAYLFEI